MDQQSRRRFLYGVGATGLVMLAGCAVPTHSSPPARNIRRIGYLSANPPGPTVDSFREGLQELGYVEGENILIEWRFARGRSDLLPGFAGEMVGLGVEVIVAVTGNGALAARQATTTIPIVFIQTSDPVGQGLVASLARPGGNLTGLSTLSDLISGKRLQLLKEAFPRISRVAVFWNVTQPGIVLQWQETQDAARTLRLELVSLGLRSPDDVDAAFATVVAERVDAIVVLPNSLTPFARYPNEFVDFAAIHSLPAIYSGAEVVRAGGLMSFAPDYHLIARRAGTYVDKVLKGARPADLPVEQPTGFEFVVKLGAAEASGLPIPQSVLRQTTDIVR